MEPVAHAILSPYAVYLHIPGDPESVQLRNTTTTTTTTTKPAFYSRRWHITTTPDLAFCTQDVHKGISREVEAQLGGSDHRPVLLTLDSTVPTETPKARWNYKKAKWNLLSHSTDSLTRDVQVQGRDINRVVREYRTL